MEFDKFLAHGTTVNDVISGCGGFEKAVDHMHNYITVDAANDAENDGDGDSATEYRGVTKNEIRKWLEANQ